MERVIRRRVRTNLSVSKTGLFLHHFAANAAHQTIRVENTNPNRRRPTCHRSHEPAGDRRRCFWGGDRPSAGPRDSDVPWQRWVVESSNVSRRPPSKQENKEDGSQRTILPSAPADG